MKKVKLTIGERVTATRILNEYGKNLPLITLKTAFSVIEKLAIDDAEWKKAKLETDEKMRRQTWNEIGSEKEIELSDDQHKLLIEFIDKKDADKNYSIDEGKFALNLITKIKGEDKNEG